MLWKLWKPCERCFLSIIPLILDDANNTSQTKTLVPAAFFVPGYEMNVR